METAIWQAYQDYGVVVLGIANTSNQNSIENFVEENSITLNKILAHYNSVVPPMKENADRSNRLGRVVENQEAIIESEEMRVNGQHN